MISIRHRLESELIEFNPTEEDWKAINSLVSVVVPKFSDGLLFPSQELGGLSTTQSQSKITSVTYNFRPQFVNTVNSVIAEEIHGNQHFAPEHHQLLEVVREYGGVQKQQLETAVYEIADKGIDQVDKLRAKQRLKDFPITAGKKTGDLAFSILQKYIESQIGL